MCIYNIEELSTVDYHLNNCHCPCWLFILILKSNCRPINIVVYLKIQGRKNTTEKNLPLYILLNVYYFYLWQVGISKDRDQSNPSASQAGWAGWALCISELSTPGNSFPTANFYFNCCEFLVSLPKYQCSQLAPIFEILCIDFHITSMILSFLIGFIS